jgi:hypothetical protein
MSLVIVFFLRQQQALLNMIISATLFFRSGLIFSIIDPTTTLWAWIVGFLA